MSQEIVSRFEKAFAEWYGVRSAFGFWKGRVAIYAILRAMGVKEGDEIVLPGYTCVTAVNPIKVIGATPIYVDIEPVTYGMDPDKLEEKITKKTKVIFAQFTYGLPPELDAILDIANKHGIPVMEDACQGLDSYYKGRKAGSFGAAAAYSMQWTKTFTLGIGGFATTNDPKLAESFESLRPQVCSPTWKENALLTTERCVNRAINFPTTIAMLRTLFRWLVDRRLLVGSSTTEEAKGRPQSDPHFFKAMGPGQGRAGLAQIRWYLDANLRHRRKMREVYDRLLAERGFPVPMIPDHMDPALVCYSVRVSDKAGAIAAARRRLIDLGDWFDQPLHRCRVKPDVYDYHEGMCPEAEKAVREVVNFPTHTRANERIAAKCVDLVCETGPPR